MKRLLTFIIIISSLDAFAQTPHTDEYLKNYTDSLIRRITLTSKNVANTFQLGWDSKVSLLGSYSNPSWITSLAWSKITGTTDVLTGTFSAGQIAFATGTNTLTSNITLRWDDANKRFEIWNAAATQKLRIDPSGILKLQGGSFSITGVSGAALSMASLNATTTIGATDGSDRLAALTFTPNGGILLTDNATTPTGITLNADYSSTLTSLSLTPKVYVDAKVADAINDGVTTIAPSENAVFDALSLKQPLDADLTTIAGLTPSANDLLQYKSGAWANRTPSQILTDLGGPFVTSVAIMKANGLNGSVSGTTTQTITLNTGVDKILTGPDPSSGLGTEGSPYTDADNTGNIQTQVNALSSGRGGSIKLAAGRYDNSSTITITSPAIDIEALSAGKQENPNGEFEGTTANKIKYSGSGSIFKWSAPTTPRISGHLRKAYLYSSTALQAASVNGSTGVGTKGVELDGYIEQSTFEEIKINNLDFGFYYNTAGTFFDVINFRQNLILGGRYGMYFGSNGTGIYGQIHNNVIADGLKHNLYVANNSNYYHWAITGNTFARGAGASGILDNPSNIFLGNNYSIFSNNIVTGAGNDFYPTPTQYGADGIIVSGTGNVVSNNVIKDNLGGAGFYGMRITGSTNTIIGNIFNNNSAQVIFDTGSSFNDLRVAPLQLAAPTSVIDNGDRNFVNGISRNAGDPNSAGNWNGNSKPWNAWIFDATNTIMYNYPFGTINNNLRLRIQQTGLAYQNLGTGTTDVAAITAVNSTHAISLSTTTAAASANAARGILGTAAANGMIIHSVGSKPIDFSIDGGTTLSGGLDGTGVWTLKRTVASTNTILQVNAIMPISTGTMADGFGGAYNFYIGSSSNLLAYMFAQRAGADNSGMWGVATANAGSSTVRLNVSPVGNIAFGKGTTTATAHYDFRGTGTTTGINTRWEDSGGTLRASVNDQGDIVSASMAGGNLTSGVIPTSSVGGKLVNWTDPNANTLVGWNDATGANVNVTIGSGLSFNSGTNTLSASGGGIGGSTGSTDNAILIANGTGGSTLQAAPITLTDNTTNVAYLATGGNSTIDLKFLSKGNGQVILKEGTETYGLAISTTSSPSMVLTGGDGTIYAPDRAGGGGTANSLTIRAGDGLGTNDSGGTLILRGGTKNGTGTPGTVRLIGTSTNNSATAGDVGEEINSVVSTYTNYTTSSTYQNIASITLTAGDWDLSAFFTYSSNSATITAASNAIFVISTTTASASGATEGVNISYVPQAALLGTSKFSDGITPYRVSISGSTTYYLNTQATFTVGNPQYVGSIRARRIR